MKPKLNILHIVTTNQLNGAERVVQFIGRYIDHNTFEPIIVCAGDPLKQIYQQEGLLVETCQATTPTPWNMSRLRSIIKNNNIHLIHAHDHRASLMAWLSTRLGPRVPIISHIHNANPWLKRWLNPFKFIEIFIRNSYDMSIACSESIREYFLRYNPLVNAKKIVAVTNGIEIVNHGIVDQSSLKKSLGIPEGNFVFATVGRLDQQKGIDFLLPAFKEVLAVEKDVSLLIVGTGPDKEALETLCSNIGLSDNVIFTGYRQDVHDLLECMDVFVLASRWEGLPMVLMEALVHSLPVISSDVGGISELIKDGETGLLVDSGDVHHLARKMLFLCREDDAASQLGVAGRNSVVDKFDVKKQVKKIEGLYRELLKGEACCQCEKQSLS